jgi:hypothetical protein
MVPCVIKQQKTDTGGEAYQVTFNCLSIGKVMVLKKALIAHDTPMARDIISFLEIGLYAAKKIHPDLYEDTRHV